MPSVPEVLSGEPLFFGRHRLLVKLGHGGMGDVYLAASEGLGGLGRLDVIKRLRNTGDPEFVAMFLNEARIAKQLHHPNIVRTYEVAQEGESYLLVMEYLHGPTLARLRRAAAATHGGVPLAIELEILCRVLDGLHHAHELRSEDGRPLGLVHRDLSPENVIVTILGECKILDFGIAKAVDSSVQTQAGFFKGKLRNVPPEQFRGQGVDRRADIFGAGVMLWEGVSGQSLWGDMGNAAISLHLARGELPPIHQMAAHVPAPLREICSQALASDPQHRFQTALAMRAAIEDYISKNRLEITRSNLASFVEPLFREERDHIDRLVRAQLTQPTPSAQPGFGAPVPTPSGQTRLGAPVRGPLPGIEEMPTEVSPSTPGGQRRTGEARRIFWGPFAALLAVAVAGGGAYLWWKGERPTAFLTEAPPSETTPAPPATSDDDETAAAYLTTAEELLREGAYEAARTLIDKTAALSVTQRSLLERQKRLHENLEYLDNQRWQAATGRQADDRATGRRAEQRPPRRRAADTTPARRSDDDGLRPATSRRVSPPRDPSEGSTTPEPPAEKSAPQTSDAPAVAPARGRAAPQTPPPSSIGGAAGRAPGSTPGAASPGQNRRARPGDVARPSLPRVFVPSDDAELRRMCARVEAEAVSVGGVRADFARGITEPLRRLVGSNAQIYPVAMYYFIVRESALGHDRARAASTLAAAQQSRLILRLKDLPANPVP